MHHALNSPLKGRFNVALTSWLDRFKKLQAKPTRLPMSDMESFKYIIYAEGHCHFANRLRQLLFMGTVILKQEVDCDEHYAGLLRPFEHYIPVDYQFSNLTTALRWADDHPQMVKQIRKNMHAYAEKWLSPKAVLDYVIELILAYSKLVLYDVKLRPGALRVPPMAAYVGDVRGEGAPAKETSMKPRLVESVGHGCPVGTHRHPRMSAATALQTLARRGSGALHALKSALGVNSRASS